jgi:hypothetical protein
LSLEIAAPPRRCFDLARSVDFHLASTPGTGESVVGGVRTGLLHLGDQVTWRARHFGIWQELTSQITAWSPDVYFRDSQVRGGFKRFDHDHYFERSWEHEGWTFVIDVFTFEAPHGFVGRAIEHAFLTSYMRRFLSRRASLLKTALESDAWRRYLPDAMLPG